METRVVFIKPNTLRENEIETRCTSCMLFYTQGRSKCMVQVKNRRAQQVDCQGVMTRMKAKLINWKQYHGKGKNESSEGWNRKSLNWGTGIMGKFKRLATKWRQFGWCEGSTWRLSALARCHDGPRGSGGFPGQFSGCQNQAPGTCAGEAPRMRLGKHYSFGESCTWWQPVGEEMEIRDSAEITIEWNNEVSERGNLTFKMVFISMVCNKASWLLLDSRGRKQMKMKSRKFLDKITVRARSHGTCV